MKLATLDDGSRDGQLVVVSRDLALAHFATGIAGRLQALLDDWNFLSPQLEDLYATLNHGKARHAFAFDAARCRPPLPRAVHWAFDPGPVGADDGGAAPPVLGRGDAFAACRDAAPAGEPGGPARAVPGVVAICGDLAAGAEPAGALDAVRLLGLVLQWRAGRHARTVWAPVAVTPDEAGAEAWAGGRLRAALRVTLAAPAGGRRSTQTLADGLPHRAFGPLLAAAAAQDALVAGACIGAFGEPLAGVPERVELLGADGSPLFGAVEPRPAAAEPAPDGPAPEPAAPAPTPDGPAA